MLIIRFYFTVQYAKQSIIMEMLDRKKICKSKEQVSNRI